MYFFLFFFTNTPTTEIYTLSLHDALPIFGQGGSSRGGTAPSRQSLEAGQARPRVRSEQPRRPAAARPTDRKSTRLNSSHTVISYAVFCLKKKKKKKKTT